jgi:hypothetical protein
VTQQLPAPRKSRVTVKRDDAAIIRFDAFLFCAAATVLITRTYLAATGYPQVGGHSELHVAHVLWGGLFLVSGVIMMLVTLGSRAKTRAALLAGVGFGLFIDEIGKFLTKDVNYFFRPAVAIIYGVFIATYLAGRALLIRRVITPARAKSMAVDAYLDQTLGDLTSTQRGLALRLLEDVADQSDPMVASLKVALVTPRVAHRRSVADHVTAWREGSMRTFTRLSRLTWFRRLVMTVLVGQALWTILEAINEVASIEHIDRGKGVTALATLVSSTVAGLLVVVGLIVRRIGGAIAGLNIILAGLMVDLLVADLFRFANSQFWALFDFAVHVVLAMFISAAITDRRLRGDDGIEPVTLANRAGDLIP